MTIAAVILKKLPTIVKSEVRYFRVTRKLILIHGETFRKSIGNKLERKFAASL